MWQKKPVGQTDDSLLDPLGSTYALLRFAHCDPSACIHGGHAQQDGLSDYSTLASFSLEILG